jgi:hypothetical protein
MRRITLVITACGLALITGCGGSSLRHGSSPAAGPALGSSPSASMAASPASASPPGQAAAAPAAGTTLATVQGEGRVNVISNLQGKGFTVVDSLLDGNQDESYLQAYDAAGNALAKLPPGSLTGECGAADVINGRGRLLITEKVIHHDAQGIQPASDTLTMTAFDATTGAQVWTTTLDSRDQNGISCTAFDGDLGSQNSGDTTFTSTANGRWGVYQPDDTYDLSHSVAIDLTTGKTYPRPGLYGALGNYVAVARMSNFLHSPVRLTLMTPGSWAAHGTLTLGDSGMFEEIPGPDNPTLVTSGAQFPTDDVADPASAVITPDASTLIGVRGNFDQGEPTTTVAYSLPSMRELWSIPTPKYYSDSVEGVNNSIVVLARQQNDGDGVTRLMALSTQSGAKVWQQNIKVSVLVCALTSSQLVLLVNDQLAFLNAGTGVQTSYQADGTQDGSGDNTCPAVLAGGVSGVSVGSDNTVSQLATP